MPLSIPEAALVKLVLLFHEQAALATSLSVGPVPFVHIPVVESVDPVALSLVAAKIALVVPIHADIAALPLHTAFLPVALVKAHTIFD